jgi:hypothetical protein
MIIKESGMLSNQWLVIGQQTRTYNNKPLDLLAIEPDGSLVLIELKRDKTPRDVVAQAIDYASWVENLIPQQIAEIYRDFSKGGNLADDFKEKFKRELDDNELNINHKIIIVAAELDTSTERIVAYLSDKKIPINVLFFQVFSLGDEQIISRTWLLDPIETQTASAEKKTKNSEPWNGEFYSSYGAGESRSWEEAVKYGFISGGGGTWYSGTLRTLVTGNRIWVKIPGSGFVGVGIVIGEAQPASEFTLENESALDILSGGSYHREYVNDTDNCEYFVPVKWLSTKNKNEGIHEIGMFGNQNTVCRPTVPKWRLTVNRLKTYFVEWDNQG